MKTYTQEEFEARYVNLQLSDYQKWNFRYNARHFPNQRDMCDCLSRWGNSSPNEVSVYENCSNCLGKAFPPISLEELQ